MAASSANKSESGPAPFVPAEIAPPDCDAVLATLFYDEVYGDNKLFLKKIEMLLTFALCAMSCKAVGGCSSSHDKTTSSTSTGII